MTRPRHFVFCSTSVFLLLPVTVFAQLPPVGTPLIPRPAAHMQQPGPRPFQLSQEDAALVDQILEIWEKESDKIKSYNCTFQRWEYDPAWTPDERTPLSKSEGQLKYAKPDKGMFRVTKVRRYDAAAKDWLEREGDVGEHWVCDGESVYEFNAEKRQLIVYPLPEEMQGQAIADGPLPFLFGAKKDKLKARYFIRVTQTNEREIWIEAFPKFQRDAANYRRLELILDRERFLPSALQVYMPNGKSRSVYIFGEAKINDPLERFLGVFQQPVTPLGWKKVILQPPSPEPTADNRTRVPQGRRR